MNRDDLKNYKYNQEWIQDRLDYIEEYKTRIEKTTTVLSDMPNGSREVEDSMAEKIVCLMDSVNNILEKIVKENNKQKMILEQLDQVEHPYRLVLEKVYIQGKSLVTTASEMNYSYERMKHINGIALNKFDKIDTKKH